MVAHLVEWLGEKTITKIISGKKHFLTRPPAIAFDAVVIREGIKGGATQIIVIDSDTGKRYKASVQQFLDGHIDLDRGWGKQMALPMGKWNRAEKKEHGEQPTLLSGDEGQDSSPEDAGQSGGEQPLF